MSRSLRHTRKIVAASLKKRERNFLAVVLASAVLAGACGNSNDGVSFPPSTEPEATTTSTETTTTTVAPTTTTETSVVETALADTERPELEIPTEWENELDEIFGRYLLYWQALDIASGPPFADPNYQPLLDLVDPGVVEPTQAQVQKFVDAEAVIVYPEDSLSDHGLRLPNPSVLEKTEGNRVVIQDCWIQDDITRFLDGRPDIENFETFLYNVDMIVIDGEWKVFAVNVADDRSDGYQECQDLFDTLEK